jgi:hypothetical protein
MASRPWVEEVEVILDPGISLGRKESSSAGGIIIPPLIIKGVVIQTRWFSDIKDDNIAIGISDSGYTNDFLCFQFDRG